MKTYKEINEEKTAKYDGLLKECNVFFAFSNNQFDENKTELEPGEKYVSMGAGGYMPKGKVEAYLNGSKEIKKWFTSEVKHCREEHILYELANHEAFYTCSIEDAMGVLPYTPKQVWDVYNKHKEAYQANL